MQMLQYVEIDSSLEEGLKPQKLDGNIEFVDVGFSYPARKEVKVKIYSYFFYKRKQLSGLILF